MKKYKFGLIVLVVATVMFGCVNKEKAINRKIKILEEEAGLALKTKNYDLVENKLEAILALKPEADYVKNNLAVICAQYSNKPDKAIQLWLEIIEADPKNAAYYNNIAGLYWKKNEYDKALEFYRKSTEYHPTYHMPYFNMAQIYIAKVDYVKAEIAATKGYEFAKTDSRMILVYAKTLLFNGKRDQALKVLTDARNNSPKVLIVNLDLARVLLGNGETQKAAKILNESLGEYPLNGILLAELIEVELLKKSEKTEIDKLFQQITASEARIFDPWLNDLFNSRKQLMNGHTEEALQALKKLAGKIPESFAYYEGLRLWEVSNAMKAIDGSSEVTEILNEAFVRCPERVPYPRDQKEEE
ncbi:tetratricopeptide repeat protein [bacterium]|nr:tetratricopeptide repeat protein [bacterium]